MIEYVKECLKNKFYTQSDRICFIPQHFCEGVTLFGQLVAEKVSFLERAFKEANFSKKIREKVNFQHVV